MPSLGLRLPDETYGYGITDVVDAATLAEEHGYHSVWVAELQGPNGFMVLGQIAARTSNVGLGTGIVNVYSRTPALLAMSAATLDEISDGRTLLGLAASSRTTIERWHGLTFDRPLRRVRESIEIVNEAIAHERIDYDGDIFDVENPRTYETVRDEIPIYNAALGATNRKLTGEFADGWLPAHVPRAQFEEFVADVKESAEASGRDPDDITVAPYVIACVDEDRDQAREYVRRLLAFYLGAIEYYGDLFRGYGFETEVDAIATAWSEEGREAAAAEVTDELLDQVAIGGTPQEGREKLREYRTLGADVPVVYPPHAPPEVIETTITELASY